jgi:alpha-1,6-mannosyltransferase
LQQACNPAVINRTENDSQWVLPHPLHAGFLLILPMHLCDITMFYAPHSGGVRRYIEAKHDWLSRQTFVRHSLLTPGSYKGRLAPYQHTLTGLPLPFSDGYRFPLRIQPWIRVLENLSPDLIEAGDPYRLSWAALEAGQCLGIPTIGFYHSDFPRLITARFGKRAGRLAERYIEHLYTRFDLVLAPSRVMQQQLQALGVSRSRVQPLGVDTERFNPRLRSRQLRRELRLGRHTRLLVFAGRNAREKHLDSLIRAVDQLGSKYHLLLVGPGMPQPSVSNVSVFSRYVDATELAGLLASSDALVHAGDMETFGLIVLEAMASGVPVVGVDAGAVPELVTSSTGMLARSSTPAHLAEAITALFERDVRQLGRAARQAVESHWTWDRTLHNLFGIYQELLGVSSPGAQQEDLIRAIA